MRVGEQYNYQNKKLLIKFEANFKHPHCLYGSAGVLMS